jgi:AhpC/TSA family
MRKCLRIKVMGGFLLGAMLPGWLSFQARGQRTAPEPFKLGVGDEAPDFTLQYFDGNDRKDVHLSDYRGKKNVVLAFYIFAFTGG